MSKKYRPWTPEQSYLLPPSPMDWLPEDHLAYFVLDVVGELDMRAIEMVIQSKDSRGERPYAPRMMVALLLYAYCTGVFSSRKIERKTSEDVAFRVLAGNTQPHFTTINTFRLVHRDALAQLFAQVLQLCQRAGLRTLGHVSLDGSKVQANASKHKAMSYRRMAEEEARLNEKIESLLAQADESDATEDAEHGDRGIEDVPAELRRAAARREVIRTAKRELETEAAQARAAQLRDRAGELRERADDETRSDGRRRQSRRHANEAEQRADALCPRDDDDDDDPSGASTVLPQHRVSTRLDGKPTDDAQRNFTDADSRIMSRNGSFIQAFNAQAAVSEDQIIVAQGLTNSGSDAPQLQPMLERIRGHFGELPEILTADAGYLSEANARYCDEHGVDAYIALHKTDHAKDESKSTTPAAKTRERMKSKLDTPLGRERYALRKVLVEPVFGQIKEAMGFRRFSLRSLAKASSEWAFVCACHNLLKLFRCTKATSPALAA